jgi:unsaturated chondroitin disaccharide hydrolase
MGEGDERVSLLRRLLQHALTTARYNIFYGEGRDAYDVSGRTAHETIFNLNDGSYRCPNSQQGYSPFTTWTRGLAWAILGYAEQLEFLASLSDEEIGLALADCAEPAGPRQGRKRAGPRVREPAARYARKLAGSVRAVFLRAARATADFYLAHCSADGIPPWDTGAQSLWRLRDFPERPADPFNAWEPVDSSAAVIAAQGLLRLGTHLADQGDRKDGRRYRQAGLTIASTLFEAPYLSNNPKHQGLLLHSVYHRPNGWDYIAPGQKVPNGESSMWGDYHARELALLLSREARTGSARLTFFGAAQPIQSRAGTSDFPTSYG